MSQRETQPQPCETPIEVRLAQETVSCHLCDFFWQPPQYGPYPGFTWKEDFPPAVLTDPTSNESPVPWLEGRSNGMRTHRPELMSGCRKAPIMTIGINPNLTAFQPRPGAAAWGYPQFYDLQNKQQPQRFAYYYRHKSVNQVSLDPEFIREHVADDDALKADKAGWLIKAVHDPICNKITLTVKYDEDSRDKHQLDVPNQGNWPVGETWVILYDALGQDVPPKQPQFSAGDILAGRLQLPENADVMLYHEITGYYDRVVPMLEGFKRQAGDRLAGAELKMAEDVCMIDMIACASPNWSAKDFRRCGSDADEHAGRETQKVIEQNCIGAKGDRHWVVKQLIQTRPAVLTIVSISSLEMLYAYLGDCFSTNFNDKFFGGGGNDGRLAKDASDFDLLDFTHEHECWLCVDESVDGTRLQFGSRLIVTPHFSYGDNFYTQARFNNLDWEAFQQTYPKAMQILNGGILVPLTPFGRYPPPIYFRRANPVYGGGTAVWLLGKDDEIQRCIEPGAWEAILKRYVDVNQQVIDILLHELEAGRLAYDENTRHLARNAGGCQFCVNDLWSFPEGCSYGKPEQPNDLAAFLEAVVYQLMNCAG